jgi:PAS domain S-box-containing protein
VAFSVWSFIKLNLPACAIGTISLFAVLIGYKHTCNIAEDHAYTTYTEQCERVTNKISEKFASYAANLDSARAFIVAAGEPDREAWRQFTTQSKLLIHNPGIYGLAYVKNLDANEIAAFIETQKSDGYESISIYNSDDSDLEPGDDYYVIAHHEPYEFNGNVIGLNLATRSRNKSVYDNATASGNACLSDGFVLAQERAPSNGLVMALPIYIDSSLGQNIDNTLGWVAIPIGMAAFFDDPSLFDPSTFNLRVHEDSPAGPLLHKSAAGVQDSKPDSLFQPYTANASFGGKTLGITFEPRSVHTFPINLSRPRFILVGGAFIGVVVTAIAFVTHRSKRAMANRLVRAVNNANIGVWEWNINTNSFRFSESYAKMLGYEHNELDISNNSWEDVCHPDDIDSERFDLEQYISGVSAQYLNEHRVRAKDGSWIWVRDIGEIIERNPDGSPKIMLGVHINIQSLRDAMERANLADIAKSEFLTNMSHEIRTPLTAILGFTELLGDSSQDYQPFVRTIKDNTDLLLTIINDILDMAKIESGKIETECISCDPVRVAQSVVDVLRINAERKDVQLAVSIKNSVPTLIQSDPTRLRQILMNLVGNAIKFTAAGNVELLLLHHAHNNTVEFRVSDTGIGMSNDQIRTLMEFRPFTQGNACTTRNYGGSGLGLSISSSLIQMLGGTLQFNSSENEGSEFYFSVPTGSVNAVARYAPRTDLPILYDNRQTSAPVETSQLSLSGVRVLIVDDGEDNQALLRHFLERAGAVVESHSNGRDCVEDLTSRTRLNLPDLVVLDIQMPYLDGIQTITALTRNEIELPYVALTAHAGSKHEHRCLEAGFHVYMTKPFGAQELIVTCRRALSIFTNSTEAA